MSSAWRWPARPMSSIPSSWRRSSPCSSSSARCRYTEPERSAGEHCRHDPTLFLADLHFV